ncbi:MAG: 3-hydroxyacyl-CoA dehydrogenase [Pseudomonadota bacterium]
MAKIGVVGVGLIGRAWANVFARAGHDVALWDANPEALNAAPGLVAQSLRDLQQHGRVNDPDAAAARVRVATSLADAVHDTALVQENGPETLDAKVELFAAMDAAAGPETILASSSSAIVASRFTEQLQGRARCLIAHPVNPPHVVPIVELCGAPWTDPDAIARSRALYDAVGQVAIEVKKEVDGFILNRMQAVLLAEAFRLISEGYVTAADLDKTIKDGLGRRWAFMGPIETIELNAPGGIADYSARYGETLYSLAKNEVTPELFSEATTGAVAESYGAPPTHEAVQGKSVWRDERLGALDAHLRAAKPYRQDEDG